MANKWKNYNKFVVIEGGAHKELTAAEYSSSYGFVGTLANGKHQTGTIRYEGNSFGGRYSEPRITHLSGSENWGPYDAVSSSRSL